MEENLLEVCLIWGWFFVMIYKSGSTGELLELSGERIKAHLRTSELYDYEWEVDAIEQHMGSRIRSFRRKASENELVVDFSGNKIERKEAADRFFSLVEADIIQEKPGKLFLGEYYKTCYMIKAKNDGQQERSNIVRIKMGVYAEYPFWIKETSYTFKSADITSTSNKRYGYRYGYRYASGMKDTYILNEHFAPAQFRLRIYGPCVNPLIAIGGRIYTVHTILEDGEYLEVDSMAQTVIKTMMNGTKVNLFHYRGLDIFQKILPGKQVVSWDGKFDFDITLFKERSEPEW